MKKVVIAFPRQRYTCDSGGQPQAFLMNEKLMAMMGGANDMRWEVIIYAKSSVDARMQIALAEGTQSDSRPSSNIYSGVALASVPASSTPTQGIVETQVNGPFAGLVDAVMKVWDNQNAGLQWVDTEVRVTLFVN